MGDFELDTRIEEIDGAAGDARRFRAKLSEDWRIWGPNGGYLATIALRAVGRVARIPRPVSFAGHFLSVAEYAETDVEVVPLRSGRRSESLRVSLVQGERRILEALVRTAVVAPGLVHDVAVVPEVPDPESLKSADDLRDPDEPERFPFWRNLERRVLHPEHWRDGQARPPTWREWYRFRPRATFDDPFLDAGRSLLLIDTLSWPAACQPHPDAPFQAPNLDVVAWFHRADPDSEWLLADHVSPLAEAGLVATTGRVFSRDGKLLAHGGAQLFCVPATPTE
jgi:acyl-CoA thioesterase-2